MTATSDASGSCFFGCSDGNGGALPNALFYSDAQLQGAPVPAIGSGAGGFLVIGLLGGVSLYRRYRKSAAL